MITHGRNDSTLRDHPAFFRNITQAHIKPEALGTNVGTKDEKLESEIRGRPTGDSIRFSERYQGELLGLRDPLWFYAPA